MKETKYYALHSCITKLHVETKNYIGLNCEMNITLSNMPEGDEVIINPKADAILMNVTQSELIGFVERCADEYLKAYNSALVDFWYDASSKYKPSDGDKKGSKQDVMHIRAVFKLWKD